MQIITKNFLNGSELEFINKFRQLDERGKAAVMSHLDHQYIETQIERRKQA